MGEYPELTALDGGMAPRLQPVGRWPWVMLLLGVAIVVLGGFLLSPDADTAPPGTPQPTATQSAVR